MRVELNEGFGRRDRSARDPSRRLLAALEALGEGRGTVLRHSQRAWASITFAGTRHTLALAFVGEDAIPAGEAFVINLPEHEFALRGQLVADAAVKAVDHVLLPEPRLTVEIELLVLDDA
jgi:hypothetical protein